MRLFIDRAPLRALITVALLVCGVATAAPPVAAQIGRVIGTVRDALGRPIDAHLDAMTNRERRSVGTECGHQPVLRDRAPAQLKDRPANLQQRALRQLGDRVDRRRQRAVRGELGVRDLVLGNPCM